MFRKPIFWIGLTVISIVSVFYSVRYFSQAFPLVTLDLQMDRETALEAARELSQRNNWGPAEFQQAASFGVDSEVQTYVELEVGGAGAFAQMLAGDLYSPYTWQVRHFKENETNETRIRFTPSGHPYGFVEKLPEDAPGASLQPDSARVMAEKFAIETWQIDFSEFRLVEQSQENRPGGRTDHTLVYERPQVQIGEGRYRLRLVVGGDKLTELSHFVKIPEAFSRKYEEMRSANDTIAFGSAMAMGVVYILGGCVIGLFFLLRQRWVLWRKALKWGLFIAFLQFLAGMNQMPLAWMNYDTALSSQSFFLQQIAANLANALLMAALLTLSFIAAESLTRKAFPSHLQLWRLWSKEVAGSKPVLGLTLAGFLLVSVFFAYDVALYFFSTKTLGWWTPSDMLFHPDSLATYFPWLTSIAISAQAGFWEESLFRAVPIAGAALLGQRFGRRTLWIIGAFILQAVIFGAGHANYPSQPAYARLVELILPSIGFGLIYLSFGLLPAIIMHFAFDVVWFALPLFVADTPNAWVNQVMVVVLTFIPVLVIFISRIRTGAWTELTDIHYNRSWQPPPKAEPVAEMPQTIEKPATVSPLVQRVVLAAGLLGAVAWWFSANFKNDAPAMKIDRGEATAQAQTVLAERGVALATPWQMVSTIDVPLNRNDRFIWQTAGEEMYEKMMGTHLGPPYWKVRYVKFEGDIAERAEEYELHIDGTGAVFRYRHILPEARAGDSLSEAQARAIADSVIQAQFQIDPATLKFISSEPSKREARQDWLFTFADTLNYSLPEGEARIAVQISGSEVTDSYRFVHVPEEWQRQERNRRTLPQIFQIGSVVMVVLLFLAGAILAIVSWSRKQFAVKTFLVIFATLFGLSLINVFNNWPALEAQFSTAQPYKNQAAIFVVGGLIGALFIAAAVGLVAGVVHFWHREQGKSGGTFSNVTALALGCAAAGMFALIGSLKPSLSPFWADYSAAATYLPVVSAGFGPVTGLIIRTVLLLLLVAGTNRFTKNWTRLQSVFAVAWLLIGIVFVGSAGIETVSSWLISGILAGAILLVVYYFVFRFDLALVPMTIAVLSIFSQVKHIALDAYPAAFSSALLAIVLLGLTAFFWNKRLAAGQ
jgi:membrane protease YdiL (CAAX protease family)